MKNLQTKSIQIGSFFVGGGNPLVLIAGPCVVENRDIVFQTAETLKAITDRLQIPFIFKASYKKANRSSGDSFITLGDEKALAILAEVKHEFQIPA